MLATATETFRCHLTWREHALHVWGWNGARPAPVGWLMRHAAGDDGDDGAWQQLPSVVRLNVPIDEGAGPNVSALRIDPADSLRWIESFLRTRPSDPSDSVIWFGQVAVLATRLVASGRVIPTITSERGRSVARWAPLLDEVHDTVDQLHRAAPAVCHHGDGAATADALSRLVDAMCRQQLDAAAWAATDPHDRQPATRLRHDLCRALCDPDPRLDRHPATEVRRLGDELRRAQRRADGQPAPVARLRLDLPDDPLEPWWVQLQLVDEDDPGRWCNAADVWQQTPLAVDLAGRPEHLQILGDTAVSAARSIAAEIEQLAPWSSADEPDEIPLELGDVEPFLDRAAHRLGHLGIDLVGPERLVASSPRLHGVVRDVDTGPGAGAGKLGRAAVVDWALVVDDGESPHRLDDASLERAAAAGSRLLHDGGRWIRLDAETIQAATARMHAMRRDNRTITPLSLLQLVAGDDDGASGPAVSITADDGWAARLLSGLGDASLSEVASPATFVGTLRPYQARALGWLGLLAELGLGGCLADDMGLGKTATTIAHLAGREGPHLVICPLSVVRNWQQECARFAPALRTRVHHGAERERGGQASMFTIADDDVVITTYGVAARDAATLNRVRWSTVVLDEAQMVKNASTIAARSVRTLQADQKLALTGTPVENRLSDLWAVLDAVNPGLMGSQRAFRDRFGIPIERHGDEAAAARLRSLTRPVVLRRTKSDRSLIPDLPDKIEKTAWATLTDEQAVMYRRVVDALLLDAEQEAGIRRRGIVLAAITRLKQICNHPAHALGDGSRLANRSGKLTRLDELLGEILDVDGQALVFTQYTAMGLLLQQHIREQLGQRVPFLRGSLGAEQRAVMVDRFQAGTDRVLLVSLRAGGIGLNLTAASHVVHYDRWWNPAVENQATDRAWRLGQRQTVMVHKLVTEGTVEERIASVIDDKRAVAEAAVASGDRWISELSTAELFELVRLTPNRVGP